LAFPGNWCHNESIRQRTTFKGEQISYTEFKKFETQLNQWRLTAGYRNTRKNKTGGTTLPLLGENTSNDWHLWSAPFNFYQEFKKKSAKIMERKTYLWINQLKFFLPLLQIKCFTIYSPFIPLNHGWFPLIVLCIKQLKFSVRYFFSFKGQIDSFCHQLS
jgi:hypothetical protein